MQLTPISQKNILSKPSEVVKDWTSLWKKVCVLNQRKKPLAFYHIKVAFLRDELIKKHFKQHWWEYKSDFTF